MKEKQLRQLILGAISIVIIVLLLLIFNNLRSRQQSSFRETIGFDFNSANFIEFSKGSNSLKFELKDSKWTVNSLQADSSRIAAVINNLFNSSIKAIISQNEGNYPLFNLDDTNARHLVIKSNAGGNSEIFIGKASVTGGMYVRFPGDKNVYEINKDLTNNLAEDITFYLSKNIISINSEDIKSFKIGESEFKKENNEWTFNGTKLNNQKITDFLQVLSSLTASSIATADQTASANFSTTDLKISVNDTINIELTANEISYYCRKDNLTYIVTKPNYDSLNKRPEDFN